MSNTTRFLGPMGAGGGDDERQMLAWLDQLLECPASEREAALLRLGLSPAQERRLRHLLGNHALTDQFLEAPDAPAPTAMQRIATPASTGWIAWSAQTRPVIAVNTTRLITRGFRSWMKSCQRAGRTVETGFSERGTASVMAIEIYSQKAEGRERDIRAPLYRTGRSP